MADYQAVGGDFGADIGGRSDYASTLRRPFDPAAHDLEASFRLTRFADLKGRGCKVPQEVLNKLVSSLQQDYTQEQDSYMHMSVPRIGIGLDCSVTPLRHGKHSKFPLEGLDKQTLTHFVLLFRRTLFGSNDRFLLSHC